MTTLTATTAAAQLLADVRHMLARHNGAYNPNPAARRP